jgi:hypothetical protein
MDKLPTLRMEREGPSDMSVHLYQITRRHMPAYNNLQSHRSKNRGTHKILWLIKFSYNKNLLI